MSNRLASATSPYLLQHADNPVDWWEWSPEAFAEAKRRDMPILLSVGYAACHWCHVMAAESFEDGDVAREMNAGFVNVKVDREERPDVDAVYMQATTALTGHGGWPMTVFLTPDGRPFHAGTYYPPTPRPGMASWRQLLAAIHEAWRDRRDAIEATADELSAALGAASTADVPASPVDVATGSSAITMDAAVAAVRALAADEDREAGGFGRAPKFPPAMVCEFLLRHAATAAPTAELARDLAARTLRAMAHSGMYDQLGGGFARYAVDRAWVVPHFEKMLYDNAQLARVYLHWWRLTGEATGRRIAEETCDWIVAALRTDAGGFASSLDADTTIGTTATPDLYELAEHLPHGGHGVEGLTYVWTPAQLRAELGEDDGAWAGDLLAVTATGTFEAGASTLQLTRDVWADPQQARRWTDIRRRLLARRSSRPQPERDDKVVAAWNGLAIAALAETGGLLGRHDLVECARQAADLLLGVHVEPGSDASRRLLRVSRDGRPGSPAGVLEDYGDVAEGLLTLGAVDGDERWFEAGFDLLDTVLTRFTSPQRPGVLYDVADDRLDAALSGVSRPRDPGDNAYPSGASAAAASLLRAGALTGRNDYREVAEAAMASVEPLMRQAPRFSGWWWAAAQMLLDGPCEVAVVTDEGRRDPLHLTALASTRPGLVVAVGRPGRTLPALLADRPFVAGRSAAYVCRGFVCAAPVTDSDGLRAALLEQ